MRLPVRLSAVLRVALVVGLLASGAAGCSGSDSHPRSSSASSTSASPAAGATATLVKTGLDQLAAGDRKSAEVTFENVLALDPHNVYAHYNLGVIEQGRGATDEARTSYDAALATDPTFGPALYNLGILTESEDLEAAVALYRRATAADPTFAPAFMRLGFALVHLGQRDEGATYLQKGVALDPSMANVDAPSYG